MAHPPITDYAPFRKDGEEPKVYTLAEAIQIMVAQAPDYHSGQVESLSDKIDVLTKLLTTLAEVIEPQLTEEQLRSLIQYPLMLGDEADEEI